MSKKATWPIPFVEPYFDDGEGRTIYLGDCREMLSKTIENSVDLILTDPPYVKGFEWVWEELAYHGSHVLKDGRSLVTLLGVINLPNAINAFSIRKGLKYWWCGGQHYDVPATYRSLQNRWKPALWYIKGEKLRKLDKWPCDMLKAKREKKSHPWQQSLGWTRYWASHLSKPDEIILDPFGGAGTTIVAAKQLGRRCVMFEMEEKHCETAAKRLERDGGLGFICESGSPEGESLNDFI